MTHARQLSTRLMALAVPVAYLIIEAAPWLKF